MMVGLHIFKHGLNIKRIRIIFFSWYNTFCKDNNMASSNHEIIALEAKSAHWSSLTCTIYLKETNMGNFTLTCRLCFMNETPGLCQPEIIQTVALLAFQLANQAYLCYLFLFWRNVGKKWYTIHIQTLQPSGNEINGYQMI